jgi:hypothetical protein
MARSIGLPTRVAVGFTTGTPDNAGTYHVSTRDAHAWPEVDFAGLGWLRFEPTPGRADPTPGNYTHTGDDASVVTVPFNSSTTTPTASTTPGSALTLPKNPDRTNISAGEGASGSKRSTVSVVLHFLLVLLALMLGTALLVAVTIIGLKALRRFRRRHAPTSRARVTGAWDEALERLAEARIHRRPSSTPVEFAMREAPAGGAGHAGPSLLALAHLTTSALYAPDEPEQELVDDAWEKVHELETAMRTHTALRARIRRRLDPRVLRAALPGDADVADDESADDALVVVS